LEGYARNYEYPVFLAICNEQKLGRHSYFTLNSCPVVEGKYSWVAANQTCSSCKGKWRLLAISPRY